jgi:uncharacterized protein (TIGR02646 family)
MIRVNKDIETESVLEAKRVLGIEKAKQSGDYNKEEVLTALEKVFSRKCYLCESKNVTSYNIEHLRPHMNVDLELKFSWDNLFLSCAHCNNLKSSKYKKILDCSKIDVDQVISFRRKGEFCFEEEIEIEALKTESEVEGIDETVELLRKIYNGTTKMKKMEAVNIKKSLRDELTKFSYVINEYVEATDEDKKDALCCVKMHLKSSSAFAAFKRWVIRDHQEELGELKKCFN